MLKNTKKNNKLKLVLIIVNPLKTKRKKKSDTKNK